MLLTPTKQSKAFASPSALEASTLEAILTCPQPADSWWSASDFRRYLVGLEAAGEVPELPSVVVIARALNKSELFGVSRTRTDEGRLLYRVRPPLARAMMLARSPAKRSPKTPERRKATPEGAPAVEADWTPPARDARGAASRAAPRQQRRPAPSPPRRPRRDAGDGLPPLRRRGRIETVLVPERGASRARPSPGARARSPPESPPAPAVAAVAATWLPSSSDDCDSDGELRASLVAAQFEDERDALARLDAAERALAADDAARGAAAETRRVAAVAAAVASDAGGDRGDCDRGDNAGGAARAASAAAAADRDRRVAQDAVVASLRGELAAARAAPPPDDGGAGGRGRTASTSASTGGAPALDGAEASSRAATPAVAVERTPERAALAAEVARLAAALAAATDAAAAEREASEADFGRARPSSRRSRRPRPSGAALDGPLSALKPKPAATPAPRRRRSSASSRRSRAAAALARPEREAASVAALAAAALRLDGVLAAAAAPAAPDSGGAERSLAAAPRRTRRRCPELRTAGAQRDAAVRDAAAAALARELDATRERLFDEGARRGASRRSSRTPSSASSTRRRPPTPRRRERAAAAAANNEARADLDAGVKRLDAVEALLSEEKKHRAALDRVALRRSRRGGDDGASVADSLSSELRRSGAQLAELRRVDGRLRREADLRPFLRYEDTPGTSYEEWRSVRSEPRSARASTRAVRRPRPATRRRGPRGAASRAAGRAGDGRPPAAGAAAAPATAKPAGGVRFNLASLLASHAGRSRRREGAAPTSRRGGRPAPRAAPPGRRSPTSGPRPSTSRPRRAARRPSASRRRVRDAAPPPSPRTVTRRRGENVRRARALQRRRADAEPARAAAPPGARDASAARGIPAGREAAQRLVVTAPAPGELTGLSNSTPGGRIAGHVEVPNAIPNGSGQPWEC
ncbi:hypothetical protein JL720_6216 [Aureococcus anophagefferens]|nr:hypothetical protein JL720_6216 [Aureococcus anophagefferens]